MILCAAGDIHGAIDLLYAEVARFEDALGAKFDWVLQVGDFGAWPDPDRADGATRRHGGVGDFPAWHTAHRPAPVRTLFIKGNHEDFVWLDAQPDDAVAAGLYHLRNGRVRAIEARGEVLRVGGRRRVLRTLRL